MRKISIHIKDDIIRSWFNEQSHVIRGIHIKPLFSGSLGCCISFLGLPSQSGQLKTTEICSLTVLDIQHQSIDWPVLPLERKLLCLLLACEGSSQSLASLCSQLNYSNPLPLYSQGILSMHNNSGSNFPFSY